MSIENILQEIIIRLDRLERRIDDLEPLEANQNTAAAPTAQVGLIVVPGVLDTVMRSDAAPPLSQAIAPTWTGAHLFQRAGRTIFDQTGIASAEETIRLLQADTSEGFIDFVGADRGIITGVSNSTESVRVEFGGAVRRIALYANA